MTATCLGSPGARRVLGAAERHRTCLTWRDADGNTVLKCYPWRDVFDADGRRRPRWHIWAEGAWSRVPRSTARLLLRGLLLPQAARELGEWVDGIPHTLAERGADSFAMRAYTLARMRELGLSEEKPK